MASNHKEVFRLYGVRRPLKRRMRVARKTRRLVSLFMKKNKQLVRGSHARWSKEGAARLFFEERAAAKGPR